MELKSPIFIIGAQRSGTNLLANTLSRLPGVAICRETHFYHYVYSRRRSFGDLASLKNRVRLVDAFLALERTAWMHVDLGVLRERLLQEATDYRSFLSTVLSFYGETQGKRRVGEQRADDRLAEQYCEWFPDAQILHMVRDPRAVVESLMRMAWAPRNVLTNARWWLNQNSATIRLEGRLKYLLVRYEDFVREPESELRRITEFLGEPYTAAALQGHSDSARRSLRAIDKSRTELWRESFSPSQVGLIEHMAGPLLETFGYKPEGIPPSQAAQLIARAREVAAAVHLRIDEFPASLYYAMGSTRIAGEEAAKHRSHRKRGFQPENAARPVTP